MCKSPFEPFWMVFVPIRDLAHGRGTEASQISPTNRVLVNLLNLRAVFETLGVACGMLAGQIGDRSARQVHPEIVDIE